MHSKSILKSVLRTRNAFARHRATILAAVVGAALSMLAFALVEKRAQQVATLEFGERARGHQLLLHEGLDEYFEMVSGLRARFQSATNPISRREFASFTDLLSTDRDGILALSWIPRVTQAERATHEQEAIAGGAINYRIKAPLPGGGMAEAPIKDEYFPVLYTTSEPIGSPIFGLDLKDGSIRQEPLERARDGNILATSTIFTLRSASGTETDSSSSCRCTRRAPTTTAWIVAGAISLDSRKASIRSTRSRCRPRSAKRQSTVQISSGSPRS